jgi:hypothetical protein
MYHESQTILMHFSSAIIVVALMSLISATAVDAAGTDQCPILCTSEGVCEACFSRWKEHVRISTFTGFDNMTHLDNSLFSIQYCHWH